MHPFAAKVYVYVTVTGKSVVLIRISLGLPLPVSGGLLIPAMVPRFQVNVVPGVPLVGIYEKRLLLQVAGGVSELLSAGAGFTTTETLYWVGLTQPLADKE